MPAKSSRSDKRVMLAARAQVAPAAEGAKVRTFSMVANTGEPMRIWPYEHPVVVDLATMDLSGLPVPALYDHCPDVDYAVGQVQSARVAGAELIADGVFTVTDDAERNYARKVLDKADAGYVWQTSIGGDPAQVDIIQAGATVNVNGRNYPGPVCVARGVVLREISFVVLGGDRRTSAVVASGGKNMAASYEDFVQSMGFDPEALDETQAANMRKLHSEMSPGEEEAPKEEEAAAAGTTKVKAEGEEETPPAEEQPTNAGGKRPAIRAKRKPVVDPTETIRASTVAELKRIREIQALAAKYGNPSMEIVASDGSKSLVPVLERAIEQKWNVEKAELEALRAGRSSSPAVIDRGHDRNCTMQSLQGAMLLRAGGRLDHKSYQGMGGQALLGKVAPWLTKGINDAERNRYMEAAHHYSHMSMLDICAESLRLAGISRPHDRDDMIRAAFSGGGNLSNIFTTNVNAILLATYDEFQEDTTQGWCSETDVNDFKSNERPRVEVGDGLKKLPRGSEAEHADYTDLVESYKIARYAKQFEIDEQDIIDDAFGVFNETPRSFGLAAARLRPDLVYGAVMLANPTLSATSVAVFSDTNDNLQGSSALAHATLSSGTAMMRLFRENSVNLNLQATHVVVPPTLEDLAIELTMSQNVVAAVGNGTFAIRGADNSQAKRGLTVVAEPRLENGVVNPADETSQSGSSSSWWLVCANARTIEVGYLRGTGRAPRVRSTVLDKGRWGMNWDVSMDIGVKALDWKGFVKSTQ